MKIIEGSVCASRGFTANGIHCGLRRNKSRKDIAVILSEVPANAAAVYTRNLVKGAPLIVTKEHLKDGKARAILCNSGNANTCSPNGIAIAEEMSELIAAQLGISANDVIISSTGVIGQKLNMDVIRAGIPVLARNLSEKGEDAAADGILTTDTTRKSMAVEFELDGKVCHLGAIAKGSGMVHPNMATTLLFVTTDVAISSEMLQKALRTDVSNTFNMVNVDGDTSTNDMAAIMANGLAGNREITEEGEDFAVFMKALNTVTVHMCRMIAGDGEGCSKMFECIVTGAADKETAKTVAKSVVTSTLVKAAIFGADANWGRVIAAIGYSGADIDIHRIEISFESEVGSVTVCKNGYHSEFSEELAREILEGKEIWIKVDLDSGTEEATAWGCDLTYEYVKINGNYRKFKEKRMELFFTNQQRAEILTQALPYIKRYNSKIVVIKYGGNAMVNEQLKEQVMADIALLHTVGVKVALVHGGGPEINQLMDRLGKKPEFVNGLRVTDRETVDIVQMVLAGKVNKDLVNLLCRSGVDAMGISGIDSSLIQAERKSEDLGYVGKVTGVNIRPVMDLMNNGYIPVISTVARGEDGTVYNINGDTAAAFIAGALGAERLILMTDISGILMDKDDPSSLIPNVNEARAEELKAKGIISGGMLPKVNCCLEALHRGVENVIIMDGTVPHSILMELLTDEGAGTMVTL